MSLDRPVRIDSALRRKRTAKLLHMLSCVGLKAGLLPFKEVHLKQRNVGSQQIGILHRWLV